MGLKENPPTLQLPLRFTDDLGYDGDFNFDLRPEDFGLDDEDVKDAEQAAAEMADTQVNVSTHDCGTE